MVLDIKEFEKVLDKEINVYLKIEKCVLEKKQSLVVGDLKKLKVIDFELNKYSALAKKLEEERNKVTSSFDKNNLTLKEIIEKIEEKEKRDRLTTLREKLKKIVNSVKSHNDINVKLIEHALKMLELSVLAIAKALIPEN